MILEFQRSRNSYIALDLLLDTLILWMSIEFEIDSLSSDFSIWFSFELFSGSFSWFSFRIIFL